MSDQLSLLDTYFSPFEAEIVRGRLETEGIKCLTRDGNIFPHLPLFSEKSGVRIYVFNQDLARAKGILNIDP